TAAETRGLTLKEAVGFQAVSGRGVEAQVEGQPVLLGNIAFLHERGIAGVESLEDEATRLADEGKTPMLIAREGKAIGIVAVADTIKPTAKEAIARLKIKGIVVAMLTGDNR